MTGVAGSGAKPSVSRYLGLAAELESQLRDALVLVAERPRAQL